MEENVLPQKQSDPAEKKHKANYTLENKNIFKIQEVEEGLDEEDGPIEQGGIVDLSEPLNPLERLEKSKMRKLITYSVLLISVIWIPVGLLHFIQTGNSFLLSALSPLSVIVVLIVRYYFKH